MRVKRDVLDRPGLKVAQHVTSKLSFQPRGQVERRGQAGMEQRLEGARPGT